METRPTGYLATCVILPIQKVEVIGGSVSSPDVEGVADSVRDVVLGGLNGSDQVFSKSEVRGDCCGVGATSAMRVLCFNPLCLKKSKSSISVQDIG